MVLNKAQEQLYLYHPVTKSSLCPEYHTRMECGEWRLSSIHS